ncbi:MAG: lasso peptide biosynthesis B2 protein [Bauldia sp.]
MTSPGSSAALLRRVRFRTELWLRARLVPLQARGRRFDSVLKLAGPTRRDNYTGLAVAYVAESIQRVTRHPWTMRNNRCLRQGLLGFRFLGEAGFRPELHFGVDPASMTADRLSAHCWVCIDGKPVLGDRLPGMATIYVHTLGDG